MSISYKSAMLFAPLGMFGVAVAALKAEEEEEEEEERDFECLDE
jgi:hypothetical protein